MSMDDRLVLRISEAKHFKHLRKIISRFNDHNLVVSPNKCEFMKDGKSCLGLFVGKDGLRVHSSKFHVITSWSKPEPLTDLQSFLGLTQFCRRFINDFFRVAAALTNLMKKD